MWTWRLILLWLLVLRMVVSVSVLVSFDVDASLSLLPASACVVGIADKNRVLWIALVLVVLELLFCCYVHVSI